MSRLGACVALVLCFGAGCTPTVETGAPGLANAKPPVPEATKAPAAAPSVPMTVAWRYSMRHYELFPWAPIEWAGPIVADGVVYAGSARGQALYALDAKDGTPKWVFHPRSRIDATPAVGGGRAYVATGKGVLWAVALDNGAELWHAEISGISTSRVLYDVSGDSERVIVPTGDNKVHCVDAKTGAELWVYRREPPADLTIWGTSSPVKTQVFGADAYLVGFSDGTLVAIKAANGTPLWEQRLVAAGRFRDVDGQVAVDGNRIYVAAYNDNLYALERDTGRVVWSAPPGGATGVAVAGGKIFHGTDSGDLLARDPADGRELWRWHVPAGVPTTPVVAGNLVFVASSSRTLYAVHADTGAIAWTFAPDYRVAGAWAQPVVDGDRVYLVSNVGTVYAFEPQSRNAVYIGTWDSGVHRGD